jgi:hypothetical protein
MKKQEIITDRASVLEMSREDLTKLNKIYETRLKPAYEDKKYHEVYKLLSTYPNLTEYLTKAQALDMTKYLLEKNNSVIKTMKSSLEKTLNKLDSMDNLK